MRNLVKGVLTRKIKLSRVERIPGHVEKDKTIYFNPDDISSVEIYENGNASVILKTNQYNFEDFKLICSSKDLPISEEK